MLDNAAVEHGAVAHSHQVADFNPVRRSGMKHATILDTGPPADADGRKIAAY
jgi:hypothetical protein